jgi:hypothetical protein
MVIKMEMGIANYRDNNSYFDSNGDGVSNFDHDLVGTPALVIPRFK